LSLAFDARGRIRQGVQARGVDWPTADGAGPISSFVQPPQSGLDLLKVMLRLNEQSGLQLAGGAEARPIHPLSRGLNGLVQSRGFAGNAFYEPRAFVLQTPADRV
jgi:hypothetical protein